MKYLILLKLRQGGMPDPKILIGLNEASKEWIKAKIASGFLDCAYNVLPSAPGYYGMGISNANSHEEGFSELASYPFAAFTDFEVYPLSDVYRAIDDQITMFKRMMGG